jgi:hypothetical protein
MHNVRENQSVVQRELMEELLSVESPALLKSILTAEVKRLVYNWEREYV